MTRWVERHIRENINTENERIENSKFQVGKMALREECRPRPVFTDLGAV